MKVDNTTIEVQSRTICIKILPLLESFPQFREYTMQEPTHGIYTFKTVLHCKVRCSETDCWRRTFSVNPNTTWVSHSIRYPY